MTHSTVNSLSHSALNAKYRPLLLNLYQRGLQKVHGKTCVYEYFHNNQILREDCSVLAVGKAAYAMACGAAAYFDDKIQCGLVITRYGHNSGNVSPPSLSEKWQILESAHPVPDKQSLYAGQAVQTFLSTLPADRPVYILLSGGASALVEDLPETITLADFQDLTHWMLGAGLSINEMNYLRQIFSNLKAGGALQYFPEALSNDKIHQLIISDVSGDALHVIGSGLFIQPVSTETGLHDGCCLPEKFHALLNMQLAATQTRQPVKRSVERKLHTQIIANNKRCREVITSKAIEQGLRVENYQALLEEDVMLVAETIYQTLLNGEPGLYIWGGEPTVTLPEEPGYGGRNQHLALLLAEKVKNQGDIFILCAGTDGTDGMTDAAGALVDGFTLQRGEQAGCDYLQAIKRADAGTFLQAAGDVLDTGPTGTNVMDIVLALKVR